jgi:predicted DsbA family dithiol-disulfide isomerase
MSERENGSGGNGASPDSGAVQVRVYSDYTCPWCYIGWSRLERLRRQLPDDVELDVRWEPFEIHPEVPDEGMPVEDLPYSDEQWRTMQEHLRQQAAQEDLEIGNRPKVSNTHRALAAGTWVQEEEPRRFPEFHRGLFEAYFARGRDLGDPEVILDVAREVGVDVEALERALASGEVEPVLEQTSRRARELGITGTPTFVFGGRYAAVGAQPPGALREVVEKVLEERD